MYHFSFLPFRSSPLSPPPAHVPPGPTTEPARRIRTLCASLLGLAVFLLSFAVAAETVWAQTIREDLYVTDGVVLAVVEAGNTIYIGGDFTHVGPATGGGVPIDDATGQPLGIPKVVGTVLAIVPDGSGGWYIGGSFTSVGGVPRSNLAHIQADHSVSSWNPNANLTVVALGDLALREPAPRLLRYGLSAPRPLSPAVGSCQCARGLYFFYSEQCTTGPLLSAQGSSSCA